MPFNFLRRKSVQKVAEGEEKIPEPGYQNPRKGSDEVYLVPVVGDIAQKSKWFEEGNQFLLQKRYKEAVELLKKAAGTSASDGHCQAQVPVIE